MKTDTTKPSHYELLLKAYDKALSTYERTITDEKTAKHFYKNAQKETSKADKKILKLEYKRVRYRRKSRKMALQIAEIHLKIWAKAHDEEVKIYQLSDTALVEEVITEVEKTAEKPSGKSEKISKKEDKEAKKEDKKSKKELKKEAKKEIKKETSKPKESKIKLERVEDIPEVKTTTPSKEVVQVKPFVTTAVKAAEVHASKPNPQIINQIKEERSIVVKPTHQQGETIRTTQTTTYVSTGKPTITETQVERLKPLQPTAPVQVEKPVVKSPQVEALKTVQPATPVQVAKPVVKAPVVEALKTVQPATPVQVAKPSIKEKPVETVKSPQTNKTVAPPKPVAKAPQAKDNLSLVEGIGAKVTQTLHDAGIHTFTQLAKADVDTLKGILKAVKNYLANPATWAEQAQLIVDNKIDELKALQETLKGGRRV
jgi:predicted flap endonuclease-1-like 5' DNA nuclease